MNIKNKVIIITGASMGIGLAAAKLFAQEGAKVVLVARSKEKIKEEAKNLPDALAIQADMTKPEDIARMIDETVKKYGRVDVLVNNAGQGLYGAVADVSVEQYRNIFELNVIGPLIATQKVIPVMKQQGGGVIVNISSNVAKNFFPHLGAYASTKYALNCLSNTARKELAKDNIIVSTVLPALTETNFGKNAFKTDDQARAMETRNQAGRPPADSAEYIAERIKLAIETGKAEIYANDMLEQKGQEVIQ